MAVRRGCMHDVPCPERLKDNGQCIRARRQGGGCDGTEFASRAASAHTVMDGQPGVASQVGRDLLMQSGDVEPNPGMTVLNAHHIFACGTNPIIRRAVRLDKDEYKGKRIGFDGMGGLVKVLIRLNGRKGREAARGHEPGSWIKRRPAFVDVNDVVREFRKLVEAYRDALKCDLVVVFDGCPPPVKAAERRRRRWDKADLEQQVVEAINTGNESVASRAMSRLVTGSSHDTEIREIISDLRSDNCRNITAVRAPAEADPQLAFLTRVKGREYQRHKLDAVITEDFDIPFFYGATVTLFKPLVENGVMIADVMRWERLFDDVGELGTRKKPVRRHHPEAVEDADRELLRIPEHHESMPSVSVPGPSGDHGRTDLGQPGHSPGRSSSPASAPGPPGEPGGEPHAPARPPPSAIDVACAKVANRMERCKKSTESNVVMRPLLDEVDKAAIALDNAVLEEELDKDKIEKLAKYLEGRIQKAKDRFRGQRLIRKKERRRAVAEEREHAWKALREKHPNLKLPEKRPDHDWHDYYFVGVHYNRRVYKRSSDARGVRNQRRTETGKPLSLRGLCVFNADGSIDVDATVANTVLLGCFSHCDYVMPPNGMGMRTSLGIIERLIDRDVEEAEEGGSGPTGGGEGRDQEGESRSTGGRQGGGTQCQAMEGTMTMSRGRAIGVTRDRARREEDTRELVRGQGREIRVGGERAGGPHVLERHL